MNNDWNNVEWTIDDIVESLTTDRHDDNNPIIPEGLIDLSPLIVSIRTVCAQGRLVKSDKPYDIGRFLAELTSCFSKRENEARLQMMVVLALILREITNCSDDVSLEEFLMRALSPERWDCIIEEFTVVPLIRNRDGKLRPNFACLPIFFRTKRITLPMLKGFSRRWWRSTLPDLFVDEFQPNEEVTSPRTDSSTPDFEVIDASEVMTYDADPFEGFDEFWDYFFNVEAAAYEKGYDIEDLDKLDELNFNPDEACEFSKDNDSGDDGPDDDDSDDPGDPDDDTRLY